MNAIETPSTTNVPASITPSYRQMGVQSAINNMASSTALERGLDMAYEKFFKSLQENNRQLIEVVEKEKIQLEANRTQVRIDITALESSISETREDIDDKEANLVKVRSEGVQTDYLPFVIGGIIMLLLMLYLFMFYASTGYSAFFGIPERLLGGFLAPDVFNEAAKYGGGAIAFIVLFPIIFLAMGFLIHTSFEKKQYGILAFILSFTLLFDVFMAYKIAANTYDRRFSRGEVELPWSPTMAYISIDFYIIIAAGFVVYIIWGYLLNYVLKEWQNMQPKQAQQTQIDQIRQQLRTFKGQLTLHEGTLADLTNQQLNKFDSKIAQCEENIRFLENGGILIRVGAVRGMVGEFLSGWYGLINLLNQAEEPRLAEREIMMADSIANNWLDKRIKGLGGSKSTRVQLED